MRSIDTTMNLKGESLGDRLTSRSKPVDANQLTPQALLLQNLSPE